MFINLEENKIIENNFEQIIQRYPKVTTLLLPTKMYAYFIFVNNNTNINAYHQS